MNDMTDYQKEINELKQRLKQQYAELVVAQEKRAGHYKKLQYQIEQNSKLQAEIEDLKEILENKKSDFLMNLVKEKYQNIDNSFVSLLERYNSEVLLNAELKSENKILFDQNTLLNDRYSLLQRQFASLQKDAKIAQEKRAGHYAKLEKSLTDNSILRDRIKHLEYSQDSLKKSLTWLLGEAFLKCKTLKGLICFPFNAFQAYSKFKTYQQEKKINNIPISRATSESIADKEQSNSKVSIHNDTQSGVDISILGWPTPNTDKPITIMSIADVFTTSNLKSVANLITPRPDNWKGLLNRDNPSLLFVESAWNGNQNSWQYRVGSYANPPGKELFEAISTFKQKGLPTVFWNKEDPVHFDKFKNSAKEFDFIFTSDERSIPAYQKISNARVFALPFAADSQVNNPIGSINREGNVCFAGSYYANRFIERRNDQLMLLESALPYGLDIYDRNAGNTNKDFRFPEQFDDCVKGSLPYDQMNEAYKKYKVFLNVNSVIDSKTMFSRRVFELLASGTPIVSTPSLGIEEFFGGDLVWIVKDRTEAQEAIRTLLNDKKEWRRRSLQGIRKVFSEHTFQDRFNFILQNTGLLTTEPNKSKILCCIEAYKQEDIDFLTMALNTQEQKDKFELVPLVILRNKKLSTTLPNVIDLKSTISNIISQYTKQNEMDFVSILSSKYIYAKNYLLDLYLTTIYTDADIISKPEQDSYAYSTAFLPAGSLFKAKIFDTNSSLPLSDKFEYIQTKLSVFMPDSANFAKRQGNDKELLKQIEI